MDGSEPEYAAADEGRLTLLQTLAYWLAPKSIYVRPPAVVRRIRGFRLVSVTRELVPTRLGRRLDFPHLGAGFEGAARQWNCMETGDPVTDGRFLDWLERVWLASIGVEAAPKSLLRRLIVSDRLRLVVIGSLP